MIKKFNNISLLVGIPGLILQIAGHMMRNAKQEGIGVLLLVVGTAMLLVGMVYYAKAKGRNPAWCLLAFLSFIGLIVLACLKDCAVEEQPKDVGGKQS